MAAVPSIGRAARVERPAAPGADAASDLYERYSRPIFGYCLHQLGSREEAEDAVQTTFMNAFRGLARGIVPELEQAWLFKIAHNVCLSRRRSSWRRGRIEAPNNLEVLQEIVPAKDKVSDELIRLQDVLEQMPENQRRAILLREWQGLSYREIATELELSQAAVETLIFRARRALAAGLEEAPSEGSLRRRIRQGADAGAVLAGLKALLGGGGAAAVKVAVTVLALASATVASTTGHHHAKRQAQMQAPAPAKSAPITVVDVARIAPTTLARSATAVAARRSAPRTATTRARTAPAPRPSAPKANPPAAAAAAPPAAAQPPPEQPAVDDSQGKPTVPEQPPKQFDPVPVTQDGAGKEHGDQGSGALPPAPVADDDSPNGNGDAARRDKEDKGDRGDKERGEGKDK